MVSNAKDRRKAAAIPVLALILGYVLWSRFTDADADGAGPAAMLTTAAQNFMQTRRETAEALEELNRMSSVNLDTALEHDPFAVLAPLNPAPADVVDADDVEEDAPADEMSAEDEEEIRQQERDQQLASLRSLEVSAVLTSGPATLGAAGFPGNSCRRHPPGRSDGGGHRSRRRGRPASGRGPLGPANPADRQDAKPGSPPEDASALGANPTFGIVPAETVDETEECGRRLYVLAEPKRTSEPDRPHNLRECA